MKLFFLWLVNELAVLIVIVFYLGTWALGTFVDAEKVKAISQITCTKIFIAAVIIGLIFALPTARFAKLNYGDMISRGFIRWTSALNLWKSEWKFFFKTLILAWILYALTVLLFSLTICALIGIT